MFSSIDDLRAICAALPDGDAASAAAVAQREAQLTKPPGSLGRLEQLVAWLARWQWRREGERWAEVSARLAGGKR